MEGINEIKQVANAFEPIEKDLNSPILSDYRSQIENVETPKGLSNNEFLSQNELNRPLSEPDTTLSDELKREIKDETGWSYNILT